MIITVLRYILLYTVIILGSIFVKYKINRKLSNSIPIYILTSIILLYVFGLFKGLLVGVYFISTISIILGLYAIIKLPKEERKKIIDPGTVFFTVIYCIFMITTYEKLSPGIVGDEFSYWSLITKSMFSEDKFILNSGLPAHYPPMPNVWEYFVCKIIGTYTQGIEFFGLYIFTFALLLPLFNIKKSKNKLYNLCIGIICICLPGIFSEMYFYSTPLADAIIGVIIGYILIQKYVEKDTKILSYSITISLIVLSLLKATGIYIAFIILGSYLIIKLYKEVKNTKKIKISNYKILLVISGIVVVFYLTWQIYIKINPEISVPNIIQEHSQETATIKDMIQSIFTVSVKSNKAGLLYDIVQENLITNLIEGKATSGYITLSIGGFLLVYFAILIFNYKRNRYKEIKFIIGFLAISFIMYIGFLQVAYFLKFDISEAIAHNSFSRYVGSYLLGMLILLCAITIDNDKEKGIINIALITILILAITPLKDITNSTINAGYYNNKVHENLSADIDEANQLKSKVSNNSKIYVIDQQLEYKIFEFYMLPENKVTRGIYFGNNDDGNERKQFLNILKDYYDYVYIRKTDDYFAENYKDLFNDEIEEKHLYKVVKSDINNLRIERID